MGFTFDNTDTNQIASSLTAMQNIINNYPENSDIIRPYIGGKEVNSDQNIAIIAML